MPTKKKKRFRNVHQTTQTTSFNFISLTLLKNLILSFLWLRIKIQENRPSEEISMTPDKIDCWMDKISKRAEEQLHLSNQYFLILFSSAKSLE